MDQPKLRPIDAVPVNVGGRAVICLRDPTDVTGNTMLVPHEALFMLAHFDGKHLMVQQAVTERAEPICYIQAVEPATQSMVSYASVVFN
jgi:hypothetical protein